MDSINNIENVAKIIIALIGALATFNKLREAFSAVKRKQELKLDLEILEKLQLNKNLYDKSIEEKIKEKMLKSFDYNTENLTNFILGIIVFIGFGLWSVEIFQSSSDFNGWIILTLFISAIGLLLTFDGKDNIKHKEQFYAIGFYDKQNFTFSVMLIFVMGILTPVLIWKSDGITFWQFLTSLMFLIGIGSFIKSIKRIK
ncbi:hypothetical protein [Olleya sp. Bg11-27]|jgi:hypothetical protein|uniref:hypothetical protein n=1 Tax=Olleya sp. Bg11-27 TaxID=2058135 RepID=UPI000C308F8F|nr:hypothetical protein [Olleya sp. Bg11-27]AUC75701.1 hypothetical protein CW732_08455 [Olleya sp. Bg11-27]